MQNTNNYYATLNDLLKITRLDQHYARFLGLHQEASKLLIQGNKRHAFDILNKMWFDPHIVPALLLQECFKAGTLIVPTWNKFPKYSLIQQGKLDGSTRPIVVPHLETRVCMGVVNSILQTSCNSWTSRTVGFRPGYGTHYAINLLANSTKSILQSNGSVTLIFFDIKKAFNSVDLKHLFNTLELQLLPKDIKYLIWQWQHTPLLNNKKYPVQQSHVEGLAQGFAYSPTLFAWYLDALLVNHFNYIIYADNIVGIFQTEIEAWNALDLTKLNLQSSGLRINDHSVSIVTVDTRLSLINETERRAGWYSYTNPPNLSTNPGYTVNWLGHGLVLPSCNVKFSVYENKQQKVESSVMTYQEWAVLLRATNWINKVYGQKWCRLTLRF
nr:hypothetical protein [Pandorina colemaniae]